MTKTIQKEITRNLIVDLEVVPSGYDENDWPDGWDIISAMISIDGDCKEYGPDDIEAKIVAELLADTKEETDVAHEFAEEWVSSRIDRDADYYYEQQRDAELMG